MHQGVSPELMIEFLKTLQTLCLSETYFSKAGHDT